MQNLKKVTLFVNGEKIGTASPDGYGRVVWTDVRLSEGENRIEVTARENGQDYADSCLWNLVTDKSN